MGTNRTISRRKLLAFTGTALAVISSCASLTVSEDNTDGLSTEQGYQPPSRPPVSTENQPVDINERGDIENIEDHGAEPNPSDPDLDSAEQNSQAIWDAASAAGQDGIIYIPKGTYYFGKDFAGAQVEFGDREPAGISFIGDGPKKSRLAMTEHLDTSNTSHVMFKYREGNDHGTVTVQEIGLDGNQFNLGNLYHGSNTRAGRGLSFQDGAAVELRNVLFEDFYTAPINFRDCDATVDRCSFVRSAVQGRKSGQVGGHCMTTHSSVTVRDCYFENNAAYVINHRYGTGTSLFKRCYVEGSGAGIIKYSAGNKVTFENFYAKLKTDYLDAEMPDHSDPTQEYKGRRLVGRLSVDRGVEQETLELNDVLIEDTSITATNIRDRLRVTGDRCEIYNFNVDDEGFGTSGAWRASDLDNGGSLFFDNFGTLSVHNGIGHSLDIRSDAAGEGSIDVFERSGNTGGLGDTDRITIHDDRPRGSRIDIDHPQKSEVGINTGE